MYQQVNLFEISASIRNISILCGNMSVFEILSLSVLFSRTYSIRNMWPSSASVSITHIHMGAKRNACCDQSNNFKFSTFKLNGTESKEGKREKKIEATREYFRAWLTQSRSQHDFNKSIEMFLAQRREYTVLSVVWCNNSHRHMYSIVLHLQRALVRAHSLTHPTQSTKTAQTTSKWLLLIVFNVKRQSLLNSRF